MKKNKKFIFIIEYSFEGRGTAMIEAESEDKAKEKFFERHYYEEDEWGEDYYIDKIKKINL